MEKYTQTNSKIPFKGIRIEVKQQFQVLVLIKSFVRTLDVISTKLRLTFRHFTFHPTCNSKKYERLFSSFKEWPCSYHCAEKKEEEKIPLSLEL